MRIYEREVAVLKKPQIWTDSLGKESQNWWGKFLFDPRHTFGLEKNELLVQPAFLSVWPGLVVEQDEIRTPTNAEMTELHIRLLLGRVVRLLEDVKRAFEDQFFLRKITKWGDKI